MATIRAPGGTISVGAEVQRLNPGLFGPGGPTSVPPAPVGPRKLKRILQNTKPLSNKLETQFGEHLRAWYPGALIYEQAITLRLANGVRYTVDWAVSRGIGVFCYEVKGRHAWDDAIVKLKVAATTFPNWHWHLAWKDVGEWQIQIVEP